MILILSDKFDLHADIVEQKLKTRGTQFFRLNLDTESLRKTYINCKNNHWFFQNNYGSLSMDQVNAVWVRRAYVELTMEERMLQDIDFSIWKNEWNKTLSGLYNSIPMKYWLSHHRNAFKAENKFLQRQIAEELGLEVPKQIVSNNKEELLAFFLENNKEVVLKLQSQEFYTVNGQLKGIYVNKLKESDLDSFQSVEENPITLQRYVPKLFEVRYTVVDKNHFVCKIESQMSKVANIDWRRYDIANTPHHEIVPPINISGKVDLLMERLNLRYGALDFIVDPSGNWIFLEINSLGQWLWIEDLTGMKISDTIVEVLENIAKGGGGNEGVC